MSKPRRTRIRLLAAERSELERRVAARTASQQDAYRAQIISRVAGGQTDGAIAQDLGLACQKPSEVDPSRAGQTHWSINDLAQYVAAHPELGLGHPARAPSASF